MLRVSEVCVQFGGHAALDHVTLDASAGAITGLIGPNGAGKTTLFNVITGIQSVQSGRVTLDGQDITSESVHRRARLGLARTFQRLETFGSLTVRENLLVAADIRRRWSRDKVNPAERAQQLLEQIGLCEVAEETADSLPTGLARLTELGRALAAGPRFLLLDEPGSGLDAGESRHLAHLIGALAREEGLAVLIVEHDMDLIMRICDRIHVLDFGVHIAEGSPAEIRNNEQVRRAYLGTTEDRERRRRSRNHVGTRRPA